MKHRIKIMAMLLCVVAFVGFPSCSKDNEDLIKDNEGLIKDNEGLIVGKWKLVQSTHAEDIGIIWEFRSDGTMTTDNPNDLAYGANVPYSISGNTLTLAGWVGYNIDELTRTDLKLSKSKTKHEFKKL